MAVWVVRESEGDGEKGCEPARQNERERIKGTERVWFGKEMLKIEASTSL